MNELVERWLSFARDDLRVAQLVLKEGIYHPRYPDALPGTLPDGMPGRSEAKHAVALATSVLKRAEDELDA